VVKLVVTDGSLTGKEHGSLRCFLAETTWQINEQITTISYYCIEKYRAQENKYQICWDYGNSEHL